MKLLTMVLTLVIAHSSVLGQLPAIVENINEEVKMVGQTVRLNCTVAFQRLNIVQWEKLPEEAGGLPTLISRNTEIIAKNDISVFTGLEKYDIFKRLTSNDRYVYTLVVRELETRDSGDYRCFIKVIGQQWPTYPWKIGRLTVQDIVTCLETVSVVTDGTINVLPNDQDVRLRCDFNVLLRTTLRVRWYNDRDIVAHYEENITAVGNNYRSFVEPVGNLTLDDASISLNVTALLEKHNVTQVTYKCLVHIFDGNSSQTSAKNTTILITGVPPRAYINEAILRGEVASRLIISCEGMINPYYDSMAMYKLSTQQKTNIAINELLSFWDRVAVPYADRYSVEIGPSPHDSSRTLYRFTIRSLADTDDGYYMCAIVRADGTSEILSVAIAEVIVLRPVQDLVLQIGNRSFYSDNIDENVIRVDVFTPVTLTCSATGSYPTPDMHIRIGGTSATRRSQALDSMIVIGTFPNQIRIHDYRMRLTLTSSDVEKDIECHASVNGLNQSVRVTASVSIVPGNNSTYVYSCYDELLLIEKRRLAVDRERLAVEQGRLALERERLEFERDRRCNP